jgi:hypothetical protein
LLTSRRCFCTALAVRDKKLPAPGSFARPHASNNSPCDF